MSHDGEDQGAAPPDRLHASLGRLDGPQDRFRARKGTWSYPGAAKNLRYLGFLPDGRRVAFSSQRSGEVEIWLADADGSNTSQLTHRSGLIQGSPRWSPDGRRIAFDSQGEDGRRDIWTIDADGASPRRLTHDPGDENNPNWSHDGRFIYFSAIPETATQAVFDIWRVPAAGGVEERITRNGGYDARESIDGRTLFFLRRWGDPSPLLAQPVAGGPEREVAKCVFAFAVGPAGLYSMECTGTPPYYVLPIIMGASMIIQTKLNPTPPDALQAKMMKIKPVVFSVVFFFFPAGLVLYSIVNNVLSILQQWHITRVLEAEAKGAAKA